MQTKAQNQSYQEMRIPQCSQYVKALLQCPERKVCTNLANSIDETHDAVYKEMKTFSQNNYETRQELKISRPSILIKIIRLPYSMM
jgi:hypothetical protein